MSTNVMTIVLYVVLVLAVLGGIGAVAYFTSGFTTDFQSFYLSLNGENILGSRSGLEMVDNEEYTFEVKYTFGAVSKQQTGYSLKVVPFITDNDFSFTVDGEQHSYSELTDITSCFAISTRQEAFTVSGQMTLQSVLEAYYGCGAIVINDPILEGHDYYTLIVYSHNKKANVQVSFHGTDAGGTFRIDPDPIVF